MSDHRRICSRLHMLLTVAAHEMPLQIRVDVAKRLLEGTCGLQLLDIEETAETDGNSTDRQSVLLRLTLGVVRHDLKLPTRIGMAQHLLNTACGLPPSKEQCDCGRCVPFDGNKWNEDDLS